LKNLIYYISIILIISISFYVSWFIWLSKLIFFIFIYWTIFYFFYIFYKKYKNPLTPLSGGKLNYKNYLINFIKKWSLSFVIIVLIIGLFWYYQNNYSPAKMTEYTISNWKKTVVFQEMAHIWSKNFYEKIKQNLINYKKDWFVYFFEWVKPGTSENMKKFNEAIWIDFNKDLYKNFSKLYWVDFQDNSIYYNLVNNLDFNVDVDIDWIMEEYEKGQTQGLPLQKKCRGEPCVHPDSEIIDINTEIINKLSELNEKELSVLRFVNKAILSALIKNDKAQSLISDNFANKALFKIILDWRNKILSDEIIKSKYSKIYITYWKLHFNWVLKLLQNNDKNWKIINKKGINSMN